MTTNIRLDLRKNDELLKNLKTLDGTKKVVVSLYKNKDNKPVVLEILKNILPTPEYKDMYNVYAKSIDSPASLVFLGTANITKTFENIQNGNETLSIMNYTKESSMDYEDIKKILGRLDAVYSLVHCVNYFRIKTSARKRFAIKNIEIPTAIKAINLAVDNYSALNNSTVTESEKYTQEALKQRHNTDSKKSNSKQLEIVIASSMIRSDLKKPLKKWRKILEAEPIEILAHIHLNTHTHLKAGHILGFYIRESTFGINGVVVDDKIIYRYELVAKCSVNDRNITSRNGGITTSGFVLKALRNAYIKYKQRESENLEISHLERLLEKNQKTSNQKRDKDLINIIAEALREIESIGKANVSKSSKAAATEDLFCKNKVNSKRNNNTTRPYQVPNPVVTILASDESKDKIKEIIEEANRAKSFPYKLDYNNNCVVAISDNLFNILECRNKLEDTLKIRKDIDVGIFTLEPTDGLVFKKRFNISSLIIYHSASKNIYALIGA